VSVEQIESFVAVAESGGLRDAARRLHITLPPLSRRIRALEDELGTELFERRARGMALTPAGHTFLPHARGILAAIALAARSVAADPPAT